MHPLVPADARIVTTPQPVYALDSLQVPLTRNEAERLSVLASRLNGRLPLEEAAQTGDDAALIRRLHEAGAVFDLPVTDAAVPVTQFCDYLYARISGWRGRKRPDQWPWREVIANGQATAGYLQGILIENYHYVRVAAVRQSPLLSRAASPGVFDLVREFVVDEAAHEGYFLSALTRWGLPAHAVQLTAPLTATAQFIALQYRLAHLSILDYLAGSATLEVVAEAYARDSDPYAQWDSCGTPTQFSASKTPAPFAAAQR